MRIIQITDLHIGLEGEETFGVDVRDNFLWLLERIQYLQPDYLMISGDLCFSDPHPLIYEWICRQLEQLNCPFDLLSGNHDDPRMMAAVFGRENQLQQGELYFTRQIGAQSFICLDTTTARISEAQLSWLSEQLSRRQESALVFMHHPPVQAGVPFMDNKHPLRDPEQLQLLFMGHPHPVYIFTGHYHVEKIIARANMLVHITPSSFFQIDQHHEEFQVDHRCPGFREIAFDPQGGIRSSVYYRH